MTKMKEDKDDLGISIKNELICLILKNRLNDLNKLIFQDGKNGGK